MKVGVQVLLFNVDRFLIPMLENCGPHVDRIYATWSPVPWSAYNPKARSQFRNKTTPDLLRQSRYFDKITLITGEWKDEAAQRNEALARARADGMDFLIVQDADEFYTRAGYEGNVRFLAQHPEADYFRGRWHVFWKNADWVLEYLGERGTLSNNENFAVNCRRDVHFVRNRTVNASPAAAPVAPFPCYHLSWLASDDEVWEKISTWGHAHQVKGKRWFETKWKGWRPASRCLSPSSPTAAFWRAVRFNGELPEELRDVKSPECHPGALPFVARVSETAVNLSEISLYYAKRGWGKIRRGFVT